MTMPNRSKHLPDAKPLREVVSLLRRHLKPSALVLTIVSALLIIPSKGRAQSQWRLGASPVTVIRDAGEASHQFTRILGGARLQDGGVVLADAGSGELREFGRDGRFRRVLVRRGEGPGELSGLRTLSRVGASLVAFGAHSVVIIRRDGSGSPQRLPIFARDGLPSGLPRAMLRDGRVIATVSPMRQIGPPTRIVRDTTRVVILSANDQVKRHDLGLWPAQSSLILESAAAPGGLKFGAFALGPQLSVIAADSVVWIGDSEQPRLFRVSAAGVTRQVGLSAVIQRAGRWAEPAVQAWREQRRAEATTAVERQFVDAQAERAVRPARPPIFRELYPDPNGGVWIERFSVDPAGVLEYVALDATGRTVGRLRTFARTRLLEVGSDYVVLAARDEDDVEHVTVYPLIRSSP